jgi:hypothetical protein
LLVKVRNGQQAGLSRTAWLSSAAASWIKLLHVARLVAGNLTGEATGELEKLLPLPERHVTEALNRGCPKVG